MNSFAPKEAVRNASPETKAETAQAAGMNRAVGINVGKNLALYASLSDTPPKDTRTEEEKKCQKTDFLNGLAREFTQFIDQFLGRMRMYQGFADAFAEMPPSQICRVWDSTAAVNTAIIKFSKEVKAIQTEQQ